MRTRSAYKLMKLSPNDNGDILSNLPDEVLAEILSLLPTIDAIKTGVLSRRWRGLWKYIHNVDISIYEIRENNCLDVQHFLSSFQTPRICKFEIKLWSSMNNWRTVVSVCVQFAVDHHVEDMTLEDFHAEGTGRIFDMGSVVRLSLLDGKIRLPEVVRLPVLTTLSLEMICVGAKDIELLISKCASLESLSLKECYHIGNTLSICHKNLRSLVMTLRYCRLTFHAPSLKFLELRGDFLRDTLPENSHVFDDISSLVKYEFHCCCPLSIDKVRAFWKLLQILHHVKIMHLGQSCLQASYMPLRPALKCTTLIVEMALSEWEKIKPLDLLLSRSPLIENLTCILKDSDDGFLGSGVWSHLKNTFPNLQELNEIEIHGLVFPEKVGRRFSLSGKWKACKHNIELVKLLMKKSVKLKTVSIHLDSESKNALMGFKDSFLFRLQDALQRAGAHSGLSQRLSYLYQM